MNNLQIFNNPEFGEIRTIQRDGEPWFVLKDVCNVLDLGSPHKVADRLEDDEKGRNLIPTPGGPQEVLIINEYGLYKVVFRSDKPKAKPFTNWVTHEVLPTIRKTGSYTLNRRPPEVSPSGLAKLISINRRVLLDMGASPVEVGAMTKSILDTYCIPVPVAFSQRIPEQLCFFDMPGLQGGDGPRLTD